MTPHRHSKAKFRVTAEETEVVVVGGGQAGLAMSEHLGQRDIPHLVLERNRIAERWRTERWDSLVANGPAWHDRFPSMEFSCAPDAFAGRDEMVDYLVAYANKIGAPVRTGVEVTRVVPRTGTPRFLLETSAGPIGAQYVVAATGPFQRPTYPGLVPADAGITQLHSSMYRNPQELPPPEPFSSSARARPGRRSPTTCCARGEMCTSPSAHMDDLHGATVAAILFGGWACSASGTSRRLRG